MSRRTGRPLYARTGHPARLELERRGITQEEVARTLGVTRSHVNAMLVKKSTASRELRDLLVAILGMPESELFDGDDERVAS